ncbi:hypothetical protein Tco_0970215 [Tanacetum coccineum]
MAAVRNGSNALRYSIVLLLPRFGVLQMVSRAKVNREPGYVIESDLEEDPEEYEDDETEDGPVDYPMDGGEDGDDDDGDSSGDDADDEDEDEGDEDDEDDEEEEKHLASADSAVVVPTVELVSPPEGTEPVPLPFTEITTTEARITV